MCATGSKTNVSCYTATEMKKRASERDSGAVLRSEEEQAAGWAF